MIKQTRGILSGTWWIPTRSWRFLHDDSNSLLLSAPGGDTPPTAARGREEEGKEEEHTEEENEILKLTVIVEGRLCLKHVLFGCYILISKIKIIVFKFTKSVKFKIIRIFRKILAFSIDSNDSFYFHRGYFCRRTIFVVWAPSLTDSQC